MKKTPLFLLLLLMGCTTSYVAQFQRVDEYPIDQNEIQNIPTNQLEVFHAFNSSDGTLRITLENNTDFPILVDMSKSAYTVNREAFPLIDGRSFIFGSIRMFGLGMGYDGVFEGEIEQTPQSLFLPPQSYIVGSYLNIRPQIISTTEDQISGPWELYPVFNYNIESKNVFFQESNSPLQIKNRISYATLDDSNQPSEPVVINQHFYLSGFSKIREISNAELQQNLAKREDMASYRKSQGMSWYLIVPTTIILGLAIILDEQGVN